MDESPELQDDRHWRMAVWALRVGYVGLAVAIVGIILMATGATSVVLVAGVIAWLAAAAVTLVGFVWSRRELVPPRIGLWSMRMKLIHDTVHARPMAQHS